MSAETAPSELPADGLPLPLGPAVVAVLPHVVLLLLYLLPWHFEPSVLVCAATARQGRPGFEQVRVTRGPGYDGQYYFRLAQQPPWCRLASRADLDSPARQLRILYPATAWFLAAGNPRRLLLVLPLVNLLAIGALALAGALLAQGRGLSPWWCVLLPFAVNADLSLFRDLTDGLGLALLALLLVGWVRNWSAPALFGLALAALLTRELSLVPLAALGVVALWRQRLAVGTALTLAVVCWLGWVGYVGWLYGEWPFLPGSGNLDRPLHGFAVAWEQRASASLHLRRALLLATLVLSPAVLVALVWRQRVEAGLLLVAVGGLLLTLAAGPAIWESYWGHARVLTLVPLATWMACIHHRSPWLAAVLALAGGVSLLTVARGFVGTPG